VIGTDVSVIPLVVAMTVGLLAFAALVPWLVHESRRPVSWGVTAPHRDHTHHARLPSLVLAARCLAVTMARRMEPTPDSVVTHWQTALVAGRHDALTLAVPARTVNEECTRAGEARTASRSSTHDISSGRRGGLRSHRGPGGRTKAQLYNEARHKNVKGRSKMNKAELERAVGR